MSISVNDIISNPNLYRNNYNNYSPYNAYYNYYDEYRNHAHKYEADYEEKRAKEIEEEKKQLELIAQLYHKPSPEEVETQIRSAWEEQRAAGKIPSQEIVFSTEITDHDEYVEKSRKEKEMRGLDNYLTPMTRAEEKEYREKERLTPRYIYLSSYDFINHGYHSHDDNLVYWIEGVQFSKNEYEECTSIINKTMSLLPTGSMDYMEYAQLGIAYNVVDTYAKENLTWAQRQVVAQSMQAYLDSYVLAEQEFYKNRGVVRDDDNFHNILDEKGGRWVSATNEGLISEIRAMFEQVDLRNQNAVNQAFGRYQYLMGIAYSFRPDSILRTNLSNAKAILNSIGKKVDYSI